jgi:hypothetical protein
MGCRFQQGRARSVKNVFVVALIWQGRYPTPDKRANRTSAFGSIPLVRYRDLSGTTLLGGHISDVHNP